MNWDRINGNWTTFKVNAQQQWDKLTDAQLEIMAGKRERLAAGIQATYGISKHAAEWQLSGWQQRLYDGMRPV